MEDLQEHFESDTQCQGKVSNWSRQVCRLSRRAFLFNNSLSIRIWLWYRIIWFILRHQYIQDVHRLKKYFFSNSSVMSIYDYFMKYLHDWLLHQIVTCYLSKLLYNIWTILKIQVLAYLKNVCIINNSSRHYYKICACKL